MQPTRYWTERARLSIISDCCECCVAIPLRSYSHSERSQMKRPNKRLQAIWRQKLKASGFDDIEYTDGSLRRADARYVKGVGHEDEIRDYYSWVQNVYMQDKHSRETKQILSLYCDGVPQSDIARKLKINPSVVWRTVLYARNAYKSFVRGH